MSFHGKHLRQLRGECTAESSEIEPGVRGFPSETGSTSPLGTPPDLNVSKVVLSAPPPRRQSGSCSVEAPKFTVEGGTFAEQVVVGITCQPCLKLRYIVEKLIEDAEGGTQGRHTILAAEGLCYRKPVVLDEYGTYMVHAMCTREDREIEVSAVVSHRYDVRATEVQQLHGKHLATLPEQMVRGFFRFADVTTKTIAPKLESMKRAIARMTKTAEDRVCVRLQDEKKSGKSNKFGGGVSVSFSVQVARGGDSETMVNGVTDPSLVQLIADTTGLPRTKITVEAAVKPLEMVLLYLEWTFALTGRDYLDGSCMVYAEDRLLDVIDYRGAQSVRKSNGSSATFEWSAGKGETGAVVHSGDVMSVRGGRHAIIVRLYELPSSATDCFFTLSAYYCRNLSKFVSPKVRFVDVEDKTVLARYDLSHAGIASAAVVCSLTRDHGGGWSVIAYGQTCDGTVRDYTPIEAAIAPVQAKYDHWRRRAPVVRLSWLWHSNRALPRANAQRQDVLMPLLDLEQELFRHVVSFV